MLYEKGSDPCLGILRNLRGFPAGQLPDRRFAGFGTEGAPGNPDERTVRGITGQSDISLILGTLIRSGTAGGVGAFLSRSVQSFYVCFLSRGVPAAREKNRGKSAPLIVERRQEPAHNQVRQQIHIN